MLSPIFRDVVLFYINSEQGSYKENMSINYIINNYSFIFKNGSKEICYSYIDAFFEELIYRWNIEHISGIKEMFGGLSVDKSKNGIYQRFVIVLSKKLKNK